MPNKTPFFIRLKPAIMDGLREAATREGTTITGIIEEALEKELPVRNKSVNDHRLTPEDNV